MDHNQKIIEIVEANRLTDTISPTFCLAKWHHTTIYLQTGQTHSCYHPAPHAIPLDELASNPSVLHNTPEKKDQRRLMLEGKKPAGCQYCWSIEAMGKDYISDRKERNHSIYTPKRFHDIKMSKWDDNHNPEYIEISFGNECNFKCGYCHPKHSSAYYKEIKDFGPYDMVKNHRNDIDWFEIYEEDTNPYVKAWWEWWPEVSKTLNILRITGGEPLLQKSTWKLLDDLYDNPKPHLELNLNSNLGVKPILIDRFTTKVDALLREQKIRSFGVFTSMDTWGKPAEYIRTGLDLTVWERNLTTYLTNTDLPITFMITFNILTVTNFKSLLEKILEWRVKFKSSVYTDNDISGFPRIRFDTPHLKEPLQYDMNILPKKEFMPYMYDSLKYIEDNIGQDKFTQAEYDKFSRVVKYMEITTYSDEKINEGRKDFYNWFTEYDRRRKTNFKSTFPELVDFLNNCKGTI
jgi:hypothetical protein